MCLSWNGQKSNIASPAVRHPTWWTSPSRMKVGEYLNSQIWQLRGPILSRRPQTISFMFPHRISNHPERSLPLSIRTEAFSRRARVPALMSSQRPRALSPECRRLSPSKSTAQRPARIPISCTCRSRPAIFLPSAGAGYSAGSTSTPGSSPAGANSREDSAAAARRCSSVSVV